jgi:hypothetical protein
VDDNTIRCAGRLFDGIDDPNDSGDDDGGGGGGGGGAGGVGGEDEDLLADFGEFEADELGWEDWRGHMAAW